MVLRYAEDEKLEALRLLISLNRDSELMDTQTALERATNTEAASEIQGIEMM